MTAMPSNAAIQAIIARRFDLAVMTLQIHLCLRYLRGALYRYCASQKIWFWQAVVVIARSRQDGAVWPTAYCRTCLDVVKLFASFVFDAVPPGDRYNAGRAAFPG